MEEVTENSIKTVEHLKPYQFKPGQSGNPGGRPKGTLKDFTRKMFMEMSDEDKREWLKSNKIQGIDIWKMAEGNPTEKKEVTADISIGDSFTPEEKAALLNLI